MGRTIKQSTVPIPPARRFEFWKDTILLHIDLALRTERDAFACERSVTPVAESTAVDTRSTPFALARTRRQIARDGVDVVALCTLTEGSGTHRQGNHDVRFTPGDLFITDLAQPYEIATDAAYRETRVYVDRALFEERLGPARTHGGLRLPAGSPLVDLFTTYLAAYVEAVPTMQPAEAERGIDGVLHLLSGLLEPVAASRRETIDTLSPTAIRDLAGAYIARRLTDPGLGVDAMVRDLGVSRTRLYAAFADAGGIQATIREARLQRVNARLRSSGATIEDIAIAAGFRDYTTFYRAFRRRFGAAPRDSRG